MQISNNVT